MLVILAVCVPESAQDVARDKLEKSPGYFGWIAVNKGGREAQSFVVYPEVSRKVMAVIVIHENRGSKERSTTALDSADPVPTFFLEH